MSHRFSLQQQTQPTDYQAFLQTSLQKPLGHGPVVLFSVFVQAAGGGDVADPLSLAEGAALCGRHPPRASARHTGQMAQRGKRDEDRNFEASRVIVVMRSAERLDRVFESWQETEVPTDRLAPSDLNVASSLKGLLRHSYLSDDPPITALGPPPSPPRTSQENTRRPSWRGPCRPGTWPPR